MYSVNQLFDLKHTLASDYLSTFNWPWEALAGIKDMILKLGPTLGPDYNEVQPQVWVHKDAVVFPTAYIMPPCIIGPNTEVRHCSFIRGSVLIGADCVIGNSVELKNAIIFDNCEVPHYNYVGDSILGWHAHMGAGSITSNIKSDRHLVVVHDGTDSIETGIRKIGAMIGDWVEIGCNAVCNPGTIVGRHATIYPTCNVRGLVPADSILKNTGEIVKKEE